MKQLLNASLNLAPPGLGNAARQNAGPRNLEIS